MTIEHEKSSGNVFADIGVAEPDDALVKADLARRIASIIKHRHLTQKDAATLLSVDQPKISRLIRGQLRDFSIEKLFRFLLKLDRDIEIVVKKKPRSRSVSRLAVCA